MGESRVDHATSAFRLALAAANDNEQARVNALLALWQRNVFAATWPGPNQAARTLTNSHGESALPLFTGADTLEASADRFNWREPDGTLRHRELPAREALRHALARQVQFIVLDVGFEHSVEFAREEVEPLVLQKGPSLPVTRERQAAVLEAVRRNSRPPPVAQPAAAPVAAPVEASVRAIEPARVAPQVLPSPPPAPPGSPRPPIPPPPLQPPPSAAARRTPTPPPIPAAAKLPRSPSSPKTKAPPSRQVPAQPPKERKSIETRKRTRDDEPTLAERPNRTNTQRTAADAVPDTTLQALSSELRGFPEVEWACVLSDESDVPLIGVRIDPSFLNRVADITDVILDVGERQSLTLQVLLLNNQDLVKNARRNGHAFYPWSH